MRRLEPLAEKFARAVLRGGGGGDVHPFTRPYSGLQKWLQFLNHQRLIIEERGDKGSGS